MALAVKDIMNGVVMHADINESLSSILGLMHRNNADAIIVREHGIPKGIITSSDIIKCLATSNKSINEIYAKDVMSPINSIGADTGIDEARNIMSNQNLKILPVKQEYDIIGALVPNDLL